MSKFTYIEPLVKALENIPHDSESSQELKDFSEYLLMLINDSDSINLIKCKECIHSNFDEYGWYCTDFENMTQEDGSGWCSVAIEKDDEYYD